MLMAERFQDDIAPFERGAGARARESLALITQKLRIQARVADLRTAVERSPRLIDQLALTFAAGSRRHRRRACGKKVGCCQGETVRGFERKRAESQTLPEHHVATITRVVEDLGEDEDWLRDVASEMEIEDGAIWVYGVGEDGVPAFTDSASKPDRARLHAKKVRLGPSDGSPTNPIGTRLRPTRDAYDVHA
jgi:hypothetical protein